MLDCRHVDQKSPRQRDMRRNTRALLCDRLLGDLDQYFLSFAQQIGDGWLLPVASLPAATTSSAAAMRSRIYILLTVSNRRNLRSRCNDGRCNHRFRLLQNRRAIFVLPIWTVTVAFTALSIGFARSPAPASSTASSELSSLPPSGNAGLGISIAFLGGRRFRLADFCLPCLVRTHFADTCGVFSSRCSTRFRFTCCCLFRRALAHTLLCRLTGLGRLVCGSSTSLNNFRCLGLSSDILGNNCFFSFLVPSGSPSPFCRRFSYDGH